ncbi:MAG: aminotransferase class IV [Deltaproteobacteria bacterium]|jgi:branched-chain amino acid aminotransferase|nr:aminotransferase class IV [Deltaproteobacteria bacterium]
MSIRVYIDGEICEPEKAMISVFDRGFLFGDSVYETVARLAGRFLFLGEHLDRLQRSARRIYIEPPARARIEQAMRETAAASGEKDARVRVVITRGAAGIDIDPGSARTPRLVVFVQPLGAPSPEMLDAGVAVAVVRQSRCAPGGVDPMVKSGNYLSSVLAMAEARRRSPGVNEAILCAGTGSIAEGATSNVFLVSGGVLCTPAVEVGILDGVTRAKVLALARENGIPTREPGFVDAGELRGADEVFLTSAVRGILPVTVVDSMRIGSGRPGPVTRQLLAGYQRLVSEAR